MYKIPLYSNTLIRAKRLKEGETLEKKVKRMIQNKEPIKDGAPMIYTEKKDGVNAAYNIRTDRFEIAAEAMDKVHRSLEAKRDDIAKTDVAKTDEDAKVIKMKKDGGAESIHGKAEGDQSK